MEKLSWRLLGSFWWGFMPFCMTGSLFVQPIQELFPRGARDKGLAAQAADEAIGTSGAESNFVCHRARIDV
jgi:hypothetical protein